MEYTLKMNDTTAVADTSGGELVSFRKAGGPEHVWHGDPAYWSGRAPVLFPIVGRLNHDTVFLEGKAYSMKQHGFARTSEFQCVAQSPSGITLQLSSSPETLAQYPFPFLLSITHTLTENGFQTAYTVKNCGPEPMPMCIGGHAGFACPVYPGENFSDYQLVFSQEEEPFWHLNDQGLVDGSLPKTTPPDARGILPVSYELFQRGALILQQVHSKQIRLENAKTGKGLRFTHHGFSALGLWTPPGKKAPFLCIEPWQGTAASTAETGEFSQKRHAVVLQPEEKFHAGYEIELL